MFEKPITREYSLMDLLKRPEIDYKTIASITGNYIEDESVADQVEVQAKYEGYIARQQDEVEKLRRSENTKLPGDFDYDVISGLSNEVKAKLNQARPETLGQASRIPGVTPAAVSLLLIQLKKRSMQGKKSA